MNRNVIKIYRLSEVINGANINPKLRAISNILEQRSKHSMHALFSSSVKIGKIYVNITFKAIKMLFRVNFFMHTIDNLLLAISYFMNIEFVSYGIDYYNNNRMHQSVDK